MIKTTVEIEAQGEVDVENFEGAVELTFRQAPDDTPELFVAQPGRAGLSIDVTNAEVRIRVRETS